MDTVAHRDLPDDRPLGVPELRSPDVTLLKQALKRGWVDFWRAPALGLFFGAVYVLIGWGITWLTLSTGQSFWLVLAAIGFPLIGPFAAVGLYEISSRMEKGQPLDKAAVFGVIWRQRSRQLPWLCTIIVILFLFWFFVGLSAMTNVSSSLDVYFTSEGLGMIAVGTLVGAGFATVLYSFSVLALPLVLDREVDFVTAMLRSIALVQDNPAVMLAWGLFLAGTIFLAMIPGFVGLLVVFPWLSHASWHVYSLLRVDSSAS